MMKKTLRFPLILFIFGLILILVACQQNAGTTEQPTEAAQPTSMEQQPATQAPTEEQSQTGAGPVEIKFFLRLSEPGEVWPTTIDRFNQMHDGKIHVTMSYVDDTTYKTKQPIELRSDNPPDVFFSWEGGWAKFLIDAGFAEPLDRYYEKYGWNDILSPGALTLATFGDTKYLVPYYMSSSAVWYRPDILQKYNLSVPTTWDELQNVCQTLKDNGVYCWMIANKENWVAQFDWNGIFVNKYGVDAYNDLINNKVPWTDPRVVDTFQTLKDFVDKGYVYPNPNSIGLLDGGIPFANGEVAMWYQGSWMPGVFGLADSPFDYDFFQFPAFPPQNPTMEVFAEETLMIHPKSPHKDEAAEFINWVVSDEIQTLRAQNGYFPANKNADISGLTPPIRIKLGQAMAAAGPFTYMHVDHAVSPPIATEFLDSLQAVIGGAMTPEDAAKATEAEAVKERGPVP